MKITKNQKRRAVSRTIEVMIAYRRRKYFTPCICPELAYSVSLICGTRPFNTQIQEMFFLEKYKPKKRWDAYLDVWFPRNLKGMNTRIAILRKILKSLTN